MDDPETIREERERREGLIRERGEERRGKIPCPPVEDPCPPLLVPVEDSWLVPVEDSWPPLEVPVEDSVTTEKLERKNRRSEEVKDWRKEKEK